MGERETHHKSVELVLWSGPERYWVEFNATDPVVYSVLYKWVFNATFIIILRSRSLLLTETHNNDSRQFDEQFVSTQFKGTEARPWDTIRIRGSLETFPMGRSIGRPLTSSGF